MTQTDIIQKLCEMVEDDKIVISDKEYKKQNDEVNKWYELLEKYMNTDKKLYNVFYNYDMEEGLRESIANYIYFKEGFLCGARLALEICGYENKQRFFDFTPLRSE